MQFDSGLPSAPDSRRRLQTHLSTPLLLGTKTSTHVDRACAGDLSIADKFLDDSTDNLYGEPHPSRTGVRHARRIVVKACSRVERCCNAQTWAFIMSRLRHFAVKLVPLKSLRCRDIMLQKQHRLTLQTCYRGSEHALRGATSTYNPSGPPSWLQ